MKQTKFLRSPVLLLTLVATTVGIFFFTSASTVDHSDSQAIALLSAEMAKVNSEILAHKAAKNEAAVSSNPFVGEITMFGGNFAPRGWALCDGQLLPIAQHDALFSLLGTTYGGDGRTTFRLPDLRGRAPIHAGQSPGLQDHWLGSTFGTERSYLRTSKAVVAPPSGRETVTVVSGLSEQVNIQQPSLGVNYIIALVGSYPSRY